MERRERRREGREERRRVRVCVRIHTCVGVQYCLSTWAPLPFQEKLISAPCDGREQGLFHAVGGGENINVLV